MQLRAENITKTLGGNTIFTNLSFEVNDGERVAIVGRNGSGKTTLFKVIAGIEQPDEGRIVKGKGKKSGIYIKSLTLEIPRCLTFFLKHLRSYMK